jgi:large subunit ribosomal protein L23
MPKDIFLIKKPWITEKATELNKIGKYVFMVKPEATKPEIRKAIKELYQVEAEKINIIRRAGKAKRFRNVRGRTRGYKKAIVTLKEGQKIDIK